MPPSNPKSNGAVATGPDARPALHPDVQPLADHLLRAGMLAIEKAVAHVGTPAGYPLSPGSLEANLAQSIQRMPAARRAAAIKSVTQRVQADPATRASRYGVLAKVNLRSVTPIERQAEALAPKLVMRDASLVAAEAAHGGELTQAPGLKLPPPYKQLRLRLWTVKCAEDTDEWSDDEIGLGTIRYDGNGLVTNQGTFTVGTDFDEEVQVDFAPRVLAKWDLSLTPAKYVVGADGKPIVVKGQHVKAGWPRTCGLTFSLAELDNGGFPDALADICDQVRDWLVKKVTTAVASLVGSYFGGALGAAVGAAIGKVVGAVVDYALGGLIGWLIGLWEDDLFPLVTVFTARSNPWQLFANGKDVSDRKMVWVQANGGRYEIYFDWQLVK
jgi:hypothetical protein